MKSFQTISGLVRQELAHCEDLPVTPYIQEKLKKSWRKRAPDAIMHTFPILFDSGKLVIYCESSVWSTSLRHRNKSLLQKIQADGIPVESVKIKLLPSGTVAINHQSQGSPPDAPSPRNAALLADTAKTLTHPGLKRALTRLSTHNKK